jgi:hypothetical protein
MSFIIFVYLFSLEISQSYDMMRELSQLTQGLFCLFLVDFFLI